MSAPKINVGDTPGNTNIDIPRVAAEPATLVEILSTVYFWAGVVAVIVIIIAGFFFVTANGNAQTVERARNAILGAVVGIVVIMSAFIITQLVIGVAEAA